MSRSHVDIPGLYVKESLRTLKQNMYITQMKALNVRHNYFRECTSLIGEKLNGEACKQEANLSLFTVLAEQ